MALTNEQKEILKPYLEKVGIKDIGEDFTPDNLSTHVISNYIIKDVAHEDDEVIKKVMGRVMNEHERAFKQATGFSKEDFNVEEGKELRFKDMIKQGVEMLTSKHQEELETLKGGIDDDAVRKLNEKLTGKDNDLKSYKKLNEELKTQLAELEKTSESKIKSVLVDVNRKDALSKLTWKDGISEVERAGFQTLIDSKYKFDLDEDNKVKVTDHNGERIKSQKNAGDFMNLSEALETLAEESALLKKNGAVKKTGFETPKTDGKETNGVSNSAQHTMRSLGLG